MMAVVKDASVPPYFSGISMAMSYVDVSLGIRHVRLYTMIE
jgi:hypothetical protein